MTTRQEISVWFDLGIARGATHMVVVCDTFDWDDYPAYVSAHQNVHEVVAQYDGKNMQKIMEVYDLRLDKEMQLSEDRAFHY